MFNDNKEIQKIVNDFSKEKNINKNLFEVSSISNATGGKEERLYNTSKVKNTECIYVIKYYKKLKLFVIWNYAMSKKMSYSLKTINEKLSRGINYADKGNGFHTLEQSRVFFDKEENLMKLLNTIFPQI